MSAGPKNLVTIDGQQQRERRKALGWTQQDLADFAGVSRSMIRQIERGKDHQGFPRTAEMIQAAFARGEQGDPRASEVTVRAPGLYYVPLNGSGLLRLPDECTELSPLERQVLVAMLRYVLGEYEGGA